MGVEEQLGQLSQTTQTLKQFTEKVSTLLDATSFKMQSTVMLSMETHGQTHGVQVTSAQACDIQQGSTDANAATSQDVVIIPSSRWRNKSLSNEMFGPQGVG